MKEVTERLYKEKKNLQYTKIQLKSINMKNQMMQTVNYHFFFEEKVNFQLDKPYKNQNQFKLELSFLLQHIFGLPRLLLFLSNFCTQQKNSMETTKTSRSRSQAIPLRVKIYFQFPLLNQKNFQLPLSNSIPMQFFRFSVLFFR